MCYVAASVLALWLKKPSRIGIAIGVLSVLHVGLLLAFAGPEGAFTLEGNFARRFDIAILGVKHVYEGYGIPFDPEGVFGALTGTCTVLLGYLIGYVIKHNTPSESSLKIYAFSAASILAGLILSIWIPINKPLWSVSYVFYAGGWAMFVLALLVYLIDVKGWEKPFFPFKAFGMNALILFVLSGLIMKTNMRFIGWNYGAYFGVNEFRSLVYALSYMLVHLVIAVIMYKKKIFIKL